MANPWNRHCANCIGALSFPMQVAALTVDAVEGDLQVVLEVLGTARAARRVVVPRVGNADGAVASSAAQLVGDGEHVAAAADEAVVASHAPADRHAPVARRPHHDHRRRRAAGAKLLVLAVLCTRTRRHKLTGRKLLR